MINKELEHAKLSASGSARWINCPGSVEAESHFPRTSSIFAEEGTLAHELADMCLKQNKDTKDFLGKEVKAKSNGKNLSVIVDKDMAHYVQEYLDYVRSFETDTHCLFMKEEKVDFSNVVPGGFGTVDATILNYKTGICNIFDLKYGRGSAVSAENNTQGMLYALGIYNELKYLETIKSFTIHIVQPRRYDRSSFDISLEDLEKFGEFVSKKAKEALSPNAPRVPGFKQCEFCAASKSCPALDKYTNEIISNEFEDLDNKPEEAITAERIKELLDNKSLIESFLKKVEANALQRMLDGGIIPGYKLVRGKSNRKWTDEAEKILADKLGEKAYDKKLIGITAAEKIMDKKEVADLVFKPDGKEVLAKEDDKRPAIESTKDCFEDIS